MRARHGDPSCCWKQPLAKLTMLPYPTGGGRFGILQCTEDRPDGCCSYSEGEYTEAEVKAEIARIGRDVRVLA